MPDDNGSGTLTATVQALTAEVRVMMVGSRQVTMSVYKQLDKVEPNDLAEIFGRVHPTGHEPNVSLHVVGRSSAGSLVSSSMSTVAKRMWPLYIGVETTYAYGKETYECGVTRELGSTRGCICEACADVPVGHRVRNMGLLQAGPESLAPTDYRMRSASYESLDDWEDGWDARVAEDVRREEWINLPLVVLAGLR